MRHVLVVACLFALLPLLPLLSSATPRQEVSVRNHPDGSLMETVEVLVQKGRPPVRHGWFREYAPNGTLVVEGRYERGQMNGRWRTWSETGVLQAQGEYSQDRGEFTHYSPDGTVQARGPMIGWARCGVWTEWYPGGRLRMRGEIVNEEMHGPWEMWTDESPPREFHAVYDHGRQVP
jgi:antitoxin component YwqK of YwqJK toxin-antitoxin module